VNPDFASSALRRGLIAPSHFPCRHLRGSPCTFRKTPLFLSLALAVLLVHCAAAQSPEIELSRSARTWEFLPIVGTRAGLFGNESGRFEAWVYPLKLFRDFHVTFHVADRALPAESLARTLTVTPSSATLVYVGDSFRVRETLFVPVHEAGAVVIFEVETVQPLEIEAGFVGDFALEWPAAMGGTYEDWDESHHAIVLGEETKKFAALVGSPTAHDAHLAYATNYSSSNETSFRLGVTQRGRENKMLVIAGSIAGRDEVLKTYVHLTTSYSDLQRDSSDYYRTYLTHTVNLELPDPALQQAYDWARVSLIQGLVTNPYLGTGLVAGYRTSGTGQRPGFAWFFGRDSFWTSFALNAAGDFSTTRTAIEFIAKYQRDDGKLPHEIAQGASFVPWFKDFPYPYASADATPLFIIATNDYVTQSGDVAFARENWDRVWKAYQFLRSTYDEQGFPRNYGIGHGWVEGGPLLPVETEYYQSALGTEALRSLSHLAGLIGKSDVQRDLTLEFERRRLALDQAFWSPDKNLYAYALDKNNQRANEPSVLATVPMWFELPESAHAEEMITRLADADHQTDWGMRIISSNSKLYDPSGYHFGSVWPLFTGWASVGEYRYHRALPAYSNLRANALLTLEGSLGHDTEVLSGDYYQSFSTSSPHQIWSAAMVVSPILRGLFGLRTDTPNREITLAPHLPADWESFAIRNIQAGPVTVDFTFHKTIDSATLEVTRTGKGDCWVEFSPAFSLRAKIVSATLNGKPLPFQVQPNTEDQHLSTRFPVNEGLNNLVIQVRQDFGLALNNGLPPLGGASHALRVISESWNASRTELRVEVSGVPGNVYELGIWNPAQIVSVENATLTGQGRIRINFPSGEREGYVHRTLLIHFAPT
jgi:GH15 family glucan-1,4-alpha-glucosidase